MLASCTSAARRDSSFRKVARLFELDEKFRSKLLAFLLAFVKLGRRDMYSQKEVGVKTGELSNLVVMTCYRRKKLYTINRQPLILLLMLFSALGVAAPKAIITPVGLSHYKSSNYTCIEEDGENWDKGRSGIPLWDLQKE